MILGYGCKDIEELFFWLRDFIPRVKNWSVCDSVCSSLTLVERYPEETWEFLKPYLHSGEEFSVRMGLILILDHFVKLGADGTKIPRRRRISLQELQGEEENAPWLDRIFAELNREFTEGYYTQMAAAWLIAELFCVFPVRTLRELKELQLDPFTRKKALQKIRESRIPDREVKEYLYGVYNL